MGMRSLVGSIQSLTGNGFPWFDLRQLILVIEKSTRVTVYQHLYQ